MLKRLANSDHASLILACRLQARGPHSEGFQVLDVQNAGEDGGSNHEHIPDVSASRAGPNDTETVPVLHPDIAPPSTSTPAPGGNLENVVLVGPQSQKEGITNAVTDETHGAETFRGSSPRPTQSRDDDDVDLPEHQFKRTVPGRGRESRMVEHKFDPLLYLGHDVMRAVLLHVVNLWDIAESRIWGTEVIPHNFGDPLVLIQVSRQWEALVFSCPELWSYVLIDTDHEDVIEHLKIFILLSHNSRLFIIVQGSSDVSDDIVMTLLQVGDRIDTLVYPPNASHSTRTNFGFNLGASQEQLGHVFPWYKLEVQSAIQPRQYVNPHFFPTSV